MRRKLSKITRIATSSKPLQIIRFDNPEFNSDLLTAPGNRAIQFNRSVVAQHASQLQRSAAQAHLACLATNQVSLDSSLIAINTRLIADPKRTGQMCWINKQYNQPQKYRIYHMPEIISGNQLVEHIEESISYPFLLFKVKRYNNIVVRFKDQNNHKREEELQHFQAWAFQQSQEQILGQSLLDWRINHGNIWLNEQVAEYFPKSITVIQEYVKDLLKIFKQYPHLLNKVPQFTSPQQRIIEYQSQMLPFQTDFTLRLVKHYSREMTRLEQKIQNGFQQQKFDQHKKIEVKVIKK